MRQERARCHLPGPRRAWPQRVRGCLGAPPRRKSWFTSGRTDGSTSTAKGGSFPTPSSTRTRSSAGGDRRKQAPRGGAHGDTGRLGRAGSSAARHAHAHQAREGPHPRAAADGGARAEACVDAGSANSPRSPSVMRDSRWATDSRLRHWTSQASAASSPSNSIMSSRPCSLTLVATTFQKPLATTALLRTKKRLATA